MQEWAEVSGWGQGKGQVGVRDEGQVGVRVKVSWGSGETHFNGGNRFSSP